MRRSFALVLLLVLLLLSCGPGETGTLQFKANGEDFVRQGLVSRDGWQITFEHIYVNLADLRAYQTDPPYDAHQGGTPQAHKTVHLAGPYLVDLAEGDGNAPPILVAQAEDAPAGHYNALSWTMPRASEGLIQGYSMVLLGHAEKEGRMVSFTLRVERGYAYTCAEYVGDERKGFLSPGGAADLELTFHLDHIFGDAGLPADDDLNQEAIGFEPFAVLARDGVVDMTMSELEAEMFAGDYTRLERALTTLGHVGEGHCNSGPH